MFSIRKRKLDADLGVLNYHSQHYGISIKQVHDKIKSGGKIIVDTDAVKIRVKLLNSDSIKDTKDKLDETPGILGRDVDRDLNMTLADLLPRVLMVLK